MTVLHCVVYNLGPAGDRIDPRGSADREIRALLADHPAILALSEAIGYRLPGVKGYRRLRDASRPGRANIAAYVRDDLPVTRVRWHDMRRTWPRTEHPGTHPARSWLEFRAGEVQVLVGHQPPKLPQSIPFANFIVTEGQMEGIRLLQRRMAPWRRNIFWNKLVLRRTKARPRIALADWNRRPGEDGWGPSRLAELIDGNVVGGRIDCAVVRNLVCVSAEYRAMFAGVRLGSDHKEAFTFAAVPRS